jgi:ribose transport system ATP-binding protein
MTAPFLEMHGIDKDYPGVRALSGLDLAVRPAEVIGIVGENGAGKSTLMKILGGVVAPTAGTIVLDGVALDRLTVAAAMRAGIAFVHQELNLFDNLSAAANILIGREPLRPRWLRLVDRAELARRAAPLLARLGADFGPEAPVARLSLAQKQLVEIAKALSLDARLVIMDEPTSSLTATETERLLAVVAGLQVDGVSVILISHRLAEIERVADRVLVLRDGRCVAQLPREDVHADTMIRHMIGRDLQTVYEPPAAPAGPPVLELADVRTRRTPDRSVSLALPAGRILGLAGLVGSGRSALARTLFGIEPMAGGEIRLDGAAVRIRSPREAIARGIYLVPEDRKRWGLVLPFPVRDNVTLPDLPRHARGGILSAASEQVCAERQRRSLDIRAASLTVPVGSLSGGNQQKVVLAKWLAMAPRVLIFDEPTRGVDVGAKREIYRLMRSLADSGVAILMISSDMEEIIGVSDQVAVMHEGRIAGFLERRGLSEAAILSLAVGRRAA